MAREVAYNAFTLGELRFVVVGRDLAPKPPDLTAAEWEVASAAATGKSNAEIAAIRGKSVHTIANQIASVLAKLGLTHRRQLAGLTVPSAHEQGGR